MGTVSHHQAMAQEFLHRADRAMTSHDPLTPSCRRSACGGSKEAAADLRREATHMATALAVHQGWEHDCRRRLEIVLHVNIADETLSHSHLKTFRQVHTLPRHLASFDQPAESNHPVRPDHRRRNALRRMRRRVASLITDSRHVIAGKPKPVRHHKRFLRQPDHPADPDFTSIHDILRLPNYEEIRQKFRLRAAPLAAEPDPHGWYDRGDIPRRCRCHAHLWNKPRDPHRITLSPLWHRALEQTFRIRLPQPLQLTC